MYFNSLALESPAWFLQRGKLEEANQALRKIASINNIPTNNKNVIFNVSSKCVC